MLPPDFFAGWMRHPMADGFILLPPGGAAAGPIRLREKLPLRALRAFVDGAIREAGDAACKVGSLRRLATVEGEQAGMVTIEIAVGEERVERTLGLVAGDDLCALVDALAVRPEQFEVYREAVTQITQSYYLGLGELRRRRFGYAPPAGWQAVARPYVTAWYAPGFPNQAAFINVFDARPLAQNPAEVDDRALTIDSVSVDAIASAPLSPGRGLSGVLVRGSGTQDGRTIHVVRARLEDERFRYIAQLHSDDDALEAGLAAFDEVVATIEPIARAGGTPAPHLRHWLD